MPKAKLVYSRSQVCRKANALMKRLAAIHGGTPKHYASEAFRKAWASEKSLTAEIMDMRGRVLDQVAQFKADQQPLARARHERQLTACMTRAEEGVARALEISRRISQKHVREAA
jgi:hypothetical protein